MNYITKTKTGIQLNLHIQPNAKKTEIAGVHGDRLKIRLKAPPVDGKANDELINFLSKLLDIPKSDIDITHGLSGRQKTVVIKNIKESECLHYLRNIATS